jgi:hypothetical protein
MKYSVKYAGWSIGQAVPLRPGVRAISKPRLDKFLRVQTERIAMDGDSRSMGKGSAALPARTFNHGGKR